jgi:hypothetical protein
VTQAELDAGTPIVNVATVTGTGAAQDTDDASVAVAQSKILHIEKDATVADGTANSTSDTIAYTYTVTNQGNAAIAGVVVTDDNRTPGSTSDDFNPSFTGGDTDGDSLLDVNETWTYTATHTVTQAELDGAAIVNTAIANGTGRPGHRRRRLGAVAQSRSASRGTLRFRVARRSTSDVIHTLAYHQGNAAIANVVDDCSRPTRRRFERGASQHRRPDQDNLLDVGETGGTRPATR